MNEEVIKSVGIDIGTSTSKFMISELTLGRVSSHFALPRFDIIDRKVIYVSDIISTPLKNEEEIELPLLVDWLEKEYHGAGLTLSEIKSGAVIITGETAIKKNASSLMHYLAERAGDFVVAIAGASLEGVLAGRGSGGYQYSLRSKRTVANIDIGGGTANVVFFRQGHVLDTITFHVGGRLIELDEKGFILGVSPSLKPWLIYRNFLIEKGCKVTFSKLAEIASALCVDMLDILSRKKDIPTLIHSASNINLPEIHEIMISGGVGRLTKDHAPETFEEVARYSDFGPLLASELIRVLKMYPYTILEAVQTSNATVIGAGMQITKLSGATITIKPEILPLRNIPVVKVSCLDSDQVALAFLKGKELFSGPFAISLGGLPTLSYRQLKEVAGVLGRCFVDFFPNEKILVIICENDMAKALGQVFRLEFDLDVICLDQIVIDHGDYIDIGEPLNHTMVPVVVKTLAFR